MGLPPWKPVKGYSCRVGEVTGVHGVGCEAFRRIQNPKRFSDKCAELNMGTVILSNYQMRPWKAPLPSSQWPIPKPARALHRGRQGHRGIRNWSYLSSRAPRQMETVAALEGSECSESVPVEGSNGVPPKKIQRSVLQRAEKGRGRARPVVVKASNASKNSFSVSEPSTETAKIRPSRVFNENQNWGLDTPISTVKSLSALNRACLEENAFNTMRLLLQHYPRMYQNFQQAGQRVEDGQNLSFVGVIVHSKGLPRGPSFGLVEVIVKSEVDEFNTSDTTLSETEEEGCLQKDDLERGRMGRTVFLHLKRFFEGSRYSNPRFLNLIARKYPENGQVSVCGKVKQLPIPDHFEIREFNIELWDGVTRDEAASGLVSDPELLSGGNPYPVYPGKGSLQPKTIEICIQRLPPLLTVALDPIPKPFREQFQIQDLHDAYRGIHSPGQLKDTEVARRRLVFDEFFYLQL